MIRTGTQWWMPPGTGSQVDLTSLTMLLPEGRTVSIGLIGAVQPGTYLVQQAAVVEQMKFCASLDVPQADLTRLSYEVTDGEVTITSVSPHIEGTFQLRATRVYVWPSEPAIGTTVRAAPTSAAFTGDFR
jgi:hypothetical protein